MRFQTILMNKHKQKSPVTGALVWEIIKEPHDLIYATGYAVTI